MEEKTKNIVGENGTTPETNTLSAEKKKNHLKGQQKKKKSKQTKEKQVRFDKNTEAAQPYAGNNKNNHVETPERSRGKH